MVNPRDAIIKSQQVSINNSLALFSTKENSDVDLVNTRSTFNSAKLVGSTHKQTINLSDADLNKPMLLKN